MPRDDDRLTTDRRAARNVRNLRDRKHYCRKCGSPWQDVWVICGGCGSSSSNRVLGYARPTVDAKGDEISFVGPWRVIPWPGQGAVAMHGGPGSGKSSLAALLLDDDGGKLDNSGGVWISKEQDPKPIGKMMRRIVPGRTLPPPLYRVEKPQDVLELLETITKGPVIMDSLTAFGLREALHVAHIIHSWTKDNNERSLCIIQVTKEGSAAGYMEIIHLFDAIVGLGADKWGMRQFRVEKNRWGPEEVLYWRFGTTGIEQPDFDASYSVEGNPGSFYLHPYPLSGSKWCGILDLLDCEHLLGPGLACAAHHASYMPTGFIKAPQSVERRRFAEANGLRWVDPDNLHEYLLDAIPSDWDERTAEATGRSSKRKGKKGGAREFTAEHVLIDSILANSPKNHHPRDEKPTTEE